MPAAPRIGADPLAAALPVGDVPVLLEERAPPGGTRRRTDSSDAELERLHDLARRRSPAPGGPAPRRGSRGAGRRRPGTARRCSRAAHASGCRARRARRRRRCIGPRPPRPRSRPSASSNAPAAAAAARVHAGPRARRGRSARRVDQREPRAGLGRQRRRRPRRRRARRRRVAGRRARRPRSPASRSASPAPVSGDSGAPPTPAARASSPGRHSMCSATSYSRVRRGWSTKIFAPAPRGLAQPQVQDRAPPARRPGPTTRIDLRALDVPVRDRHAGGLARARRPRRTPAPPARRWSRSFVPKHGAGELRQRVVVLVRSAGRRPGTRPACPRTSSAICGERLAERRRLEPAVADQRRRERGRARRGTRNANRPLSQSHASFTSRLSRASCRTTSPRRMSTLACCSPALQCGQIVSTDRQVERPRRRTGTASPSARPTGQIWTVLPAERASGSPRPARSPTCSAAPRSNSSMNRSPEIWSQNRVHRAHSTQRSRSRSTSGDSGSGLRIRPLRLDVAALAGAERQRLVLQRALAAAVADRAVERVVEQQELEVRHLGVLRPASLGVLRRHDHARRHRSSMHDVMSLRWPSTWT